MSYSNYTTTYDPRMVAFSQQSAYPQQYQYPSYNYAAYPQQYPSYNYAGYPGNGQQPGNDQYAQQPPAPAPEAPPATQNMQDMFGPEMMQQPQPPMDAPAPAQKGGIWNMLSKLAIGVLCLMGLVKAYEWITKPTPTNDEDKRQESLDALTPDQKTEFLKQAKPQVEAYTKAVTEADKAAKKVDANANAATKKAASDEQEAAKTKALQELSAQVSKITVKDNDGHDITVPADQLKALIAEWITKPTSTNDKDKRQQSLTPAQKGVFARQAIPLVEAYNKAVAVADADFQKVDPNADKPTKNAAAKAQNTARSKALKVLNKEVGKIQLKDAGGKAFTVTAEHLADFITKKKLPQDLAALVKTA